MRSDIYDDDIIRRNRSDYSSVFKGISLLDFKEMRIFLHAISRTFPRASGRAPLMTVVGSRKCEAANQCCFNVGSVSWTLAQH